MPIFTSESVSVGHPDKLADQISDSLLDAFLASEPETHRGTTRVAIETLLTRGLAVVAGEVRTEGYVDIPLVVREAIRDTGYIHTDYGFDGKTCGVMVAIQEQSADIAAGVDSSTNAEGKIGAGDQGMMFGYATNETPELMPLPLAIAHALTAQSVKVRKEMAAGGDELMLLPDAKSQVSVEYGEDGVPVRIDTVVLSHQHTEDYREAQHEVRNLVRKRIIDPVLARFAAYDKGDVTFHINPTGVFVEGGPQGDTGVTGRKIIVDTYGGMAPHGGGAFSGKDPTKVDRSAAYAARYIAKNVVAAGLASRCVVHLAYAIGVADPVAIHIETFGTETVPAATIVERIRANFQLTPAGIAEMLQLLRPTALGLSPGLRELVRTKKIDALPTEGWNYHMTAQNGHFGNPAFPWERTDRADALKG